MDQNKQHDETLAKAPGVLATGLVNANSPVSNTPVVPTATAEVTTAATLTLPTMSAGPAQQKEPQQRSRSSATPAVKGRRPEHMRSNTWQAPSMSSGSSGSPVSYRPRGQKQNVHFRTFEQIQAEHQYLFASLHRQDSRVRTFIAALSTVQAQLQEASSPAEARRLRKNAGFIQSKITDAEQQERLILVRLGEVCAELQSRHRLSQLQQQRQHILAHAHIQEHGLEGVEAGPQGQAQAPPQAPHFLPYGSVTSVGENEMHGPPTTETQLFLSPTFIVSPVTPGIEASMLASPVSPSGSPIDSCMSPMSPLAPVFQPGSSYFFRHTTPKATAGRESLGGTTLDFVVATEDKGTFSVSSPAVKRAVDEVHSERESKVGLVGMHCVYDADEGKCDFDAVLPKDVRLRRGSHSAAQPLQDKEKRRSLPPVHFSWPEENTF